MKSVGINYTKMTRQEVSLCRTISLCSENFARQRKFRSAAKISLGSEIAQR